MMCRIYSGNRYRGSSLIELLIASGLSCAVLLAAIKVLHLANAGFIWQDQAAILQESGRYAISLIEQGIRQIAYVDYTRGIDLTNAMPDIPAIWGADARSVKSGEFSISNLDRQAINGSDVLVMRFPGASASTDGSVVNCAGFVVQRVAHSAEIDRGLSIFYVAKNSAGEPELRCKYRGNTEWDSQAIVSGVESFQVLYGIDTDGDRLPNQYVNATVIHQRESEKNTPTSLWKKVVSVWVSLLLHAPDKLNTKGGVEKFDLFGSDYADAFASEDPGTRILRHQFPVESRSWYRQLVQSLIYLRNSPEAALP